MLAILLLAAISRCASPALCPSDEDLISAVRGRDAASAEAAAVEAAAAGEIVMSHGQRIRRIKDVVCGDRLPGDLPTVTCKMTVRYWSADTFQVAKLVRQDGTWRIAEALMVTRSRR